MRQRSCTLFHPQFLQLHLNAAGCVDENSTPPHLLHSRSCHASLVFAIMPHVYAVGSDTPPGFTMYLTQARLGKHGVGHALVGVPCSSCGVCSIIQTEHWRQKHTPFCAAVVLSSSSAARLAPLDGWRCRGAAATCPVGVDPCCPGDCVPLVAAPVSTLKTCLGGAGAGCCGATRLPAVDCI